MQAVSKASNFRGLELTDAVTLFTKIPKYWAIDPRVTHYIMKKKDTQRKSAGANLPITDDWLSVSCSNGQRCYDRRVRNNNRSAHPTPKQY